MLGHEVCGGVGQRRLLQVFGDPGGGQHILDQRHVGRGQRFQVQVRCPASVDGVALVVDLNELHAA